jgi:hypothetical protein
MPGSAAGTQPARPALDTWMPCLYIGRNQQIVWSAKAYKTPRDQPAVRSTIRAAIYMVSKDPADGVAPLDTDHLVQLPEGLTGR